MTDAKPHSPPAQTKPPHAEPRCWNCGYALAGLKIEDTCPECGTPVYSIPMGPPRHKEAQAAQNWGMFSLVFFFVILGPAAILLAIPAIIKGRRVLREVRCGRISADAAKEAKSGLIMGWITVVLTAIFLAAMAIGIVFF